MVLLCPWQAMWLFYPGRAIVLVLASMPALAHAHAMRQTKDAFLANATTIPYCNLPPGKRNYIPPLAVPDSLSSVKLLQVGIT